MRSPRHLIRSLLQTMFILISWVVLPIQLKPQREASTNIENITQSARNNIKKYLNADFQINYNKGFKGVVIGLRQLLKLRYKGEVTMLNI